jgi:hypothetical protein
MYSSLRAPIRSVTTRLKRRTCAIAPSAIT